MLTLERIRNIRFHKAKKEGYQPEEVDSFIEEVVSTFEAILNERTATKRRMEELEKDLAACRAREGSVGEALLAAQHQADIVLSEAQSKANLTLEEARLQAAEIIAGTKGEVDEQKQIAETLRQEVTAFKGRLLQLYREHLTLIDALPETRAEAPAEDVPAAEPEVPAAAEPEVAVESSEQPTANAEPEQEVTDISSVSPVEPIAAPVKEEPLAEEKVSIPALFDDEDETEYVPTADPDRYSSLQFGDDYEDVARGGLFRKKK